MTDQVREVLAGEFCALYLVLFRVDGEVGGVAEVGALQVGVVEDGAGEIAVGELGVAEVGIAKICLLELTTSKLCLLQLQFIKGGAAHIAMAETDLQQHG